MKQTADGDYQVSILEVASSSATEQDILRLESLWMKKLTTTTHGLNSSDYANALAELRPLAAQGNAEAEYKLGLM